MFSKLVRDSFLFLIQILFQSLWRNSNCANYRWERIQLGWGIHFLHLETTISQSHSLNHKCFMNWVCCVVVPIILRLNTIIIVNSIKHNNSRKEIFHILVGIRTASRKVVPTPPFAYNLRSLAFHFARHLGSTIEGQSWLMGKLFMNQMIMPIRDR